MERDQEEQEVDEEGAMGGGRDMTIATGLVNGRLSLATKQNREERLDAAVATGAAELMDADGGGDVDATDPSGSKAKSGDGLETSAFKGVSSSSSSPSAAAAADPMDVENHGARGGDSKAPGATTLAGSNENAGEKGQGGVNKQRLGTPVKGVGEGQGVTSAVAAAGATVTVDDVSCPSVVDVIVHPVGAVDGPAALRRLVLAMHLDNGDLLVYEARMSMVCGSGEDGSEREQVCMCVCVFILE